MRFLAPEDLLQEHTRPHCELSYDSIYHPLLHVHGWKLIMQSDNKLSKFEPLGLFNLNENPTEDPTGNQVENPSHAQRIDQMRNEYLRIRKSGQRTTLEIT
jgi:arylsulfatase A